MSERNGGAVAWSDRPDPDRRPFYPIWSPTPDRDILAIILSAAVLGVYTHHFQRRTRPCVKPRQFCEGCIQGIDQRWKGYLAGFDGKSGRSGIVELTHEGFLRCPELTADEGRLRGKAIRLVRAGSSRTARVVAKIMKVNGPLDNLPPAFDLKAALERVWFTIKGGAEAWMVGPGPQPEEKAGKESKADNGPWKEVEGD